MSSVLLLIHEREATFHDPAWLSTTPSLSASTAASTAAPYKNSVQSPSFLEEDLEIVQNALRLNGCLLESARKFALELITDAVDYSMAVDEDVDSDDVAAASGALGEITPADLQLALEMQGDHHVSSG